MDASASCSSNTDKCKCENLETSENKDQPKSTTSSIEIPKERKSRISFPSFGLLRKSRVLNFTSSGKGKKEANVASNKKASRWTMKFNCSKKEPKNDETQSCCQCTCYKRSEEINDGASTSTSDNVVPKIEQESIPPPVCDNVSVASHEEEECEGAVAAAVAIAAPAVVFDPVVAGPSTEPEQPAVSNETEPSPEVLNRGIYSNSSGNIVLSVPSVRKQWIQLGWIHEDCDEAARIQRAREIEQGVEAPANFRPVRRVQLLYTDSETEGGQAPRRLQLVCPPDLSVDSLRAFFQNRITLRSCPLDTIAGCHTQVDFIHCLVPDLLAITNCSFYWGKMDRYEAERLLDGKTEGTFLLRDSAQEEFLFSVSFRKYNRSLHARIEQWNHKFSFDAHDPGVYTSDTVCGLIEHYKDPGSCMFFEPVLTWPLHRNFSFSLQHLCRSVIVDRLHYDDINQLQLPKCLKSYLKEYHYRQKVRVERFDDDVQWLDCRNVPS